MVVAEATGKPIPFITSSLIPVSFQTNTDPRGNAGEEVVDEPFNFANARRRSNSSSISSHSEHFKTKFEINEPEPVFEESLHGPEMTAEEDEDISKTETSSRSGASV